jgi:hypothetical protein
MPFSYGVNEDNLFILNKNEKCCTFSMYNSDLEMVQTCGQENTTLPFFCSLEINLFLFSNQYFLINETFFDEDDDFDYNSLTIINRSNGLVESSFKIFEYFHQMHVYLDKFLITFSDDTCILKTYNLKGDLLGKITLDDKFRGSFFTVLNKELYFNVANDKFVIF